MKGCRCISLATSFRRTRAETIRKGVFDASGLATGALGGLGIGGVEGAGAGSSNASEWMYSKEETVQPTLSNALITTGSSSTFSSGSSSAVSVSGGSSGQKFREGVWVYDRRGVAAVNKTNLEKYDLVFMVIMEFLLSMHVFL